MHFSQRNQRERIEVERPSALIVNSQLLILIEQSPALKIQSSASNSPFCPKSGEKNSKSRPKGQGDFTTGPNFTQRQKIWQRSISHFTFIIS